MTQVCDKCSRVNPADAAYCYYDGAILAGHTANGGPINQGSAAFPSQFVFPSGQSCRNFDQLALTCQQNWKAAVDLLKHGFLSSFLGGLGRADLALAAQEAAQFPDQDRGLDQFLSRLPTHVLDAPKLKAEPSEVNLGQVPIGTDRHFDLHLMNLGMRLVYGSVVSDCKWLTLGESPGNAQKLFQFGSEMAIRVQVRGQHLRAGTKALVGKLVVESNGGTVTIMVRADVPVKPYIGGVLAGSISPRQIAEKAKANPKEAAALFENGSVAEWFTLNGWKYPVQGPSASGLGAVQQFFEALGLARAPKVEISTNALVFRGNVGECLQATFEVKTPENKYVYAHATCEQAWLQVERAKLNGRNATITVKVPSVPNRPGESLQANLNVMGNGNQRFVIPVSLAIGGTPGAGPFATSPFATSPFATSPIAPGPSAANPFADMSDIEPIPVATVSDPDVNLPPLPAAAFTAASQAPPGAAQSPVAQAPGAPFMVPPPLPADFTSAQPSRHARQGKPMWLHLIPLAVLAVALVIIMLRDRLASAPAGGEELRIGVYFDYSENPKDRKSIGQSMRFGLVKIDDVNDPNTFKKLTFDSRGTTNSTLFKIDGIPRFFGFRDGMWESKPRIIPADRPGGFPRGMTGAWMFLGKIQATQTVTTIPGEPVEVAPGVYKRFLDTCLVRYQIENTDRMSHRVGVRFLLDTMIGDNDGPSFIVPGRPDLVTTKLDVAPPERVPDFVRALEVANVSKPGTVAQINFRLSDAIEPPSRVSLTHWHKEPLEYNIPITNIEKVKDGEPYRDSAVVMYWDEKDMKPGARRTLGFTVGLGGQSVQEGVVGLSVGGSFAPGGELTVVALVGDQQPKQTITLELPKEFTFVDKSAATQEVPAGQKMADGRIRPSPVTWRIRSTVAGTFDLQARTSAGGRQRQKVNIKTGAIF